MPSGRHTTLFDLIFNDTPLSPLGRSPLAHELPVARLQDVGEGLAGDAEELRGPD